jgi:hypothetical protein
MDNCKSNKMDKRTNLMSSIEEPHVTRTHSVPAHNAM